MGGRRSIGLGLVLVLVAGCGGGGGGGDDSEMPLAVDVDPVTEGDWYRPAKVARWQWQLTGELNTGYDVAVYDIDLFDTPADRIATLQAAGRKVICYFSAGSSEDWREDFERFSDDDMGKKLGGWDGERWLDIRSTNVHAIMHDRLDLAAAKGCDGVEPDNVDAYTNASGFDLTAADQLAYNRHIANEAHRRGLAVGLKNDGGQAAALVDYYDFELNEQCHAYDECSELAPFTVADKPIFNAEYADDAAAAAELAAAVCPRARAADIRTLILPLDLDDSFRIDCDDH